MKKGLKVIAFLGVVVTAVAYVGKKLGDYTGLKDVTLDDDLYKKETSSEVCINNLENMEDRI